MKKLHLILFVLIFQICILQINIVSAEDIEVGPFPDVEVDSPYYTAIEYFREKDIIQGYTDGTFRPYQEATRAEALKIILLSSNVEVEELFLGLNIFPDVSIDDWHYPYIKKAKELEIVEGYPDGYFRPHQTLNIAETLKIILITNSIETLPIDEFDSVFPDVTGEVWFAPYAQYAKDKNIIEPQGNGQLNAGRGITRGELVELMYRTEIVIANDQEPFDISTNWPVKQFPEHGFQAKHPFTWVVVHNEDEIVFWRPDDINHQSSYEVPFPFSASVVFHLDINEDSLSASDYEENLDMVYKSDFGSYQKNKLTIAGYEAIEYNVSIDHDDFFVFVPDNKILQIYTSYGWSDLTEQLVDEINAIIENVSYVTPQDTTSQDILSEARSRILVEGMGQTTLDLFTDLVNIETDIIGVGTGPVDYFYTAQYDVTIKYERASDTILDIQNGKTTAF